MLLFAVFPLRVLLEPTPRLTPRSKPLPLLFAVFPVVIRRVPAEGVAAGRVEKDEAIKAVARTMTRRPRRDFQSRERGEIGWRIYTVLA
jgi:hypothetical protein